MKHLNLMGSVSQTGYGVVCFNFLKYLTELGWEISLFTKGGTDRQGEELALIKTAVERAQKFNYDAPCLNVWHQFDLANRIGRGKYVAYPFFELDCFREVEIHHLNYPDELVISSKWAQDVLTKNKVTTSSTVVSPGVDLHMFNPSAVPPKQNDNTIFLNCGKWEVRKGHDFLVDVFHQAFNKDDSVELWLLPHNPFLTPQEARTWENMYLNSALGRAGKIKIFPWLKTHAEVSALMSQADCGVFPSRAEGWNLELLEMMALGKPVIATDYSAHTEFCNTHNCNLIPIDDIEPAYDGKWFHEEGNWAKIGQKEMLSCKEHMRNVYETQQNAMILHNDPGVETSKNFSWEKSVEKLDTLLSSE